MQPCKASICIVIDNVDKSVARLILSTRVSAQVTVCQHLHAKVTCKDHRHNKGSKAKSS